MDSKTILIAIPTATGNISAKLVQDLFYLDKPFPVGLAFVSRTMIDVARNKLAIQAIEHKFDYLFFVDDDMTISKDTLAKLIEADKDIIGGVYISRHDQMPCVFEAKKEGNVTLYRTLNKIDGIQEVDAMGTGCMLIKREVLIEMAKKHDTSMFEFAKEFVNGVLNQKGEDVIFCERAKELGFEVWAHAEVKPGHLSLPSYLTYS
jgi:hypothetical protein